MVLKLDISSDAESSLRARAAKAGLELELYASALIERIARQPVSLDDLRGSTRCDAMSEDELSEFLEGEKHTMREEKRSKRSKRSA